jgi:hypothetical protein
LFPD